MADDTSTQDKTEEPTARRIDDARRKGQVARSQELSSVAIITTGFVTIFVMSSTLLQQMSGIYISHFSQLGKFPINVTNFYYLFQTWGLQFARLIAPFLLVMAVIGFFATYFQVGPLFSFETLEPNLDKLDIVKGFKRIISAKSLFDLFRDSTKIIIVGMVAYLTLRAEVDNYIPLIDKDLGQILIFGSKLTFKLGLRCAFALLILAILDFAYQKYVHKKGLRMSKQEIKEEMKQFEGDPMIKAKIRRIQREQAMKRMFQDVQTADVVVTNPTEIAVGLKYDSENMGAPIVGAKGQRLIAEKIKEIAKRFSIPIIEDRPLAQALFKYVGIGMQIPEHLYRAVAEILAYVHRLKNKAI